MRQTGQHQSKLKQFRRWAPHTRTLACRQGERNQLGELYPAHPFDNVIELHLMQRVFFVACSHLALEVAHRCFKRRHAEPQVLGLGLELSAELAQRIAQRFHVLDHKAVEFVGHGSSPQGLKSVVGR